MKIEIEKRLFIPGGGVEKLGTFDSLESAHKDNSVYRFQQDYEDIHKSAGRVPYLHLIEYRDDEHYNDLFFTKAEIINEID